MIRIMLFSAIAFAPAGNAEESNFSFEVQVATAISPRADYAAVKEGIAIFVGNRKFPCPLSTSTQRCTVVVSNAELIVDVEIRLEDSVDVVFGADYAIEPLRFSLVRGLRISEVIKASFTPAARSRINNENLAEIYSNSGSIVDSLAAHKLYQVARLHWLNRKDQEDNAYKTVSAFMALRTAEALRGFSPPFRPDLDPAMMSAAEFVLAKSDSALSRALSKKVRHPLALEAQEYARRIGTSASGALIGAWRHLRLQPEGVRIGLLDEFEKAFDRFSASFSPGELAQFTTEIGISKSVVYDSKAQMLALLYRCGEIETDYFIRSASPVIEYLQESIRQSSQAAMPEPVAATCRSTKSVPDIGRYCSTVATLTELIESEVRYPPPQCP